MKSRATRQVKKLAGKVALVTGGAARVGRAIALALAREGADVAVGYHASSAAARATVADLEALGVRAVALRADHREARGRARAGGRAPRAGWDGSTSSSTMPPSSSGPRSPTPPPRSSTGSSR